MPLSLPGVLNSFGVDNATLSGFVPGGLRTGGPQFITGEPRRDYHFTFLLTRDSFSDGLTMGFSQIALMYVSGLAQKVTLPEEKFDVTPVQLGAVSFPFPKGTVLQNLSVEFLDDEISSVYRFHRMWMGMVSGSGGMVFTELGKVCLSALFMPIKRYPAFGGLSSPGTSYGVGLDAPVGAERFPHLFPVSVSRSAYDRSGSSVIKTSVTYVRVPDMSNVLYHKYPGKAKDTIW